MFCLGAWVVCGFDSNPLQLVYAAVAALGRIIPVFYNFTGVSPSMSIIDVYNFYYGKEMHWSAFVIYFGMFWFLSKHFSKEFGIVKSKNVAYAASITFFNIAIFEYFWIYSFAYWQNQWWVGTWAMPQLRILFQNLGFLTVGIFGVLYLWIDSYILKDKEILGRHYTLNLKSAMTISLLIATVALALLWWYYPWPVQQITVQLKTGGVWISSQHFPQTLYTVKLDPGQRVNAGEWFWIENNYVHGLNTLLKFVWGFAWTSLFIIKKVESK